MKSITYERCAQVIHSSTEVLWTTCGKPVDNLIGGEGVAWLVIIVGASPIPKK